MKVLFEIGDKVRIRNEEGLDVPCEALGRTGRVTYVFVERSYDSDIRLHYDVKIAGIDKLIYVEEYHVENANDEKV